MFKKAVWSKTVLVVGFRQSYCIHVAIWGQTERERKYKRFGLGEIVTWEKVLRKKMKALKNKSFEKGREIVLSHWT